MHYSRAKRIPAIVPVACLIALAASAAAENPPTSPVDVVRTSPAVAQVVSQIPRVTGVVRLPVTGWPAAGGDQAGSCTTPNCVAAACRAVSVRALRTDLPSNTPRATALPAVHPVPVSSGDWHHGCRFSMTGLEAGVAYRVVATLPYDAWMPPEPPGSQFGFKGFCPSQTGSFTLGAANPQFACPSLQLVRMQ